ncbi:MAG TPA: acyltransferase family protein [Acidimicrobiia bacterium]|nr:acyltransferase family protein [Acidimicrobiia bacterium]
MVSRRVRIPYVAALDGLRGVAVAGVLLFHGGHLTGGYLGVDLFFVLSGFLITSLLLAESDHTGEIALRAFWSRRARRLLPALAAMLAFVLLYATFVAAPGELSRIRGDALATLGYVANWRDVLSHFDYWALFSAPSPLEHTWSLAIEEQFYVVWPLLFTAILWWGARRGRGRRDARATARRVLTLSCVLAVVSGVLAVVLFEAVGTNRVYYGTDTRAAAILLGAGLAALVKLRGPVRTRVGRAAVEVTALAGVAVLVFAWTRLGGGNARLYEGGLFACSLAGAAVIAAATDPRTGPIARVLQLRPLVLLGIISYGVYLWHWPVFVWLDHDRTGLAGWTLFALQVAATLAVSVASFFLLERPIRHGALHAPQWRVITPAVAGVLVIGVIASTAGYVAPVESASSRATQAALPAAIAQARAHPDALRVDVVGNSVADFLARDGFAAIDTDPRMVVHDGAFPACNFPPVTITRADANSPQVSLFGCTTYWATEIEQFRPQIVVMTFGDFARQSLDKGTWYVPCTDSYARWFDRALRDATETLTKHGAHLVIVTTAPAQIYGESRMFITGTHCADDLERRFAARDPRVSLVDLEHHLCRPNGVCRSRQGDIRLRPDGVHFKDAAARIVAAWVFPQLGSRTAGGAPGRVVSSGSPPLPALQNVDAQSR